MSDEPTGSEPHTQEHPRSASARTIIRNYWREHSLSQIATLLAEQYLGLLLRWLPGFEGIALRSCFYRLLFGRLEGFAFIYPGAWLDHSYNISAGPSLAINTGAYISARAPIRFGSGVLVGPNVVIVSSNHRFDRPDLPISEQGHALAAIRFGDDCWIGANAVILAGVSVADGTIVSAGAVVTRDTEPYSIVGGSPATKIGQRPRDVA
jgi:acetyltransferase-like isoleucine patch superfamily enzyme